MVIDTKLQPKFIRHSEILNKFYAEIRSYPVLTPEEEVKLFISYKDGDNESRERIIKSNQRFVVAVAKRFASTDIELMEMISEGNLGLIHAIDKFDITYGFKFISYAVHWIKSYIFMYLNKKSPIRKRVDYKLNKYIKEIQKLLAMEERDPTDRAIVSLLNEKYNIHVEEKDLCNITYNSIDISEDDTEYSSGITDFNESYYSYNEITDIIDNEHNRYLIDKCMNFLTDKEREVVKLYFGIDSENECPMSFSEIGRKLHITSTAANHRYQTALYKMKRVARRLFRLEKLNVNILKVNNTKVFMR